MAYEEIVSVPSSAGADYILKANGLGGYLWVPNTFPSPSSTTPLMDGTANAGSETAYARGDHVHPTDTSRAASSHSHGNVTNAGAITASGVAAASGDAFIIADSSDSGILKKCTATFDGSTTTKALSKKGTFETFLTSHQSLSDYAKLASPTFTGTPKAPTASTSNSSTQLATTAFVHNAIDAFLSFEAENSESTSISTDTETNLQTHTFAAGLYLVLITVRWNSNSNGHYRRACFSTTKTTMSNSLGSSSSVVPVQGANTYNFWAQLIHPTSSTKYYVNVLQDSGNSITAISRLQWLVWDT